MTPQSESTPHPIDPAMADVIAPEPALDATEVAIPALDAVPGWSGSSDWQRLPQRAYRVFLYVAVFVALPPTLFISASLYANRFRHDWTWLAMAGLWVASISLVLWVAHKRYRHTHWKLDADGFSVRRGRLWQWETRVPTQLAALPMGAATSMASPMPTRIVTMSACEVSAAWGWVVVFMVSLAQRGPWTRARAARVAASPCAHPGVCRRCVRAACPPPARQCAAWAATRWSGAGW